MKYLDEDRLMSIAQGPRNCSVTDVEDLCSEVAYQAQEIERLNAVIAAQVTPTPLKETP